MAVVQVTRLQFRSGLHEDLPQLATGEPGWCVDTRQLFIGNGTIEEGAPSLGNTEILTEYSDVFALRGVYTYKGERGTYIVQTGQTTLSPSSRSLQDKLDDFANVRDFGAVGDGITDDTAAINRAISQLYKSAIVGTQPLVRRTLYFPAGKYLLSDAIKLLPYVRLVGEGRENTILYQTHPAVEAIVTADSDGKTGVDNGLNNAVGSVSNELIDLSVYHQFARDVIKIDSVVNFACRRVGLYGTQERPISPAGNIAAIVIYSTAKTTQNVVIDDCILAKTTYGIRIQDQAVNVVVNRSQFSENYRGVVVNRGKGVIVTQNYFDLVSDRGIYSSADAERVVSAHNHFNDVGNTLTGTQANIIVGAVVPSSPIIDFNSNGCHSVADVFMRTTEDSEVFPTVEFNNTKSSALRENGSLSLGTKTTYSGVVAALSDGVVVPAIIDTPLANTNLTVVYELIRGTASRVGTLRAVRVGSSVQYDDDYTETASIGIELTPSLVNDKIVLTYTSTATSVIPSINYSVTSLT